ncbi:MAG: hypothetical protein ACI4D8_02965 [Wujia sp.]
MEIYTISDAVYIKMKNDVAYLISNTIALYEQQSTINPNMPVRGFMYYGELYSKYIETHGLSVYGRRLIRQPNG